MKNDAIVKITRVNNSFEFRGSLIVGKKKIPISFFDADAIFKDVCSTGSLSLANFILRCPSVHNFLSNGGWTEYHKCCMEYLSHAKHLLLTGCPYYIGETEYILINMESEINRLTYSSLPSGTWVKVREGKTTSFVGLQEALEEICQNTDVIDDLKTIDTTIKFSNEKILEDSQRVQFIIGGLVPELLILNQVFLQDEKLNNYIYNDKKQESVERIKSFVSSNAMFLDKGQNKQNVVYLAGLNDYTLKSIIVAILDKLYAPYHVNSLMSSLLYQAIEIMSHLKIKSIIIDNYSDALLSTFDFQLNRLLDVNFIFTSASLSFNNNKSEF